MKTLYKYRIWCNTENTYVTKWSEIALTTCPNNNGHSVNTSLVDITETYYGKN